jgi:hypothetical protein
MNVGGGLNYVTGPMGAGKTLYAVRAIVDAVTTSRYVITNVELLPDAFERIAAHVGRLVTGKRDRGQLAERLAARYVYETDLAQAMKYRLPGSGEGRGLFIWDEGHNDLNNRDWRKEGRDDILRWATQLRKLGFVGFLLSQHADNTDAALRRVCNYQVRLQNQREQTRVLGMRITPWPLFLAYWYPAHLGLARQQIPPTRVERYFLGWHKNLYDTHGLFHGLDAGEFAGETIMLGALPAGASVPREGHPRGRATGLTSAIKDALSLPVRGSNGHRGRPTSLEPSESVEAVLNGERAAEATLPKLNDRIAPGRGLPSA